jgi:hypothetical protein
MAWVCHAGKKRRGPQWHTRSRRGGGWEASSGAPLVEEVVDRVMWCEQGRWKGGPWHVGHYGGQLLGRLPWTLINSEFFYLFKQIPNRLGLTWAKDGLPVLQKIEIKYDFEGFEDRNNFLHRNFFRPRLDFEWKFRETRGFEFSYNLIGSLLGIFKLDETWTRDL